MIRKVFILLIALITGADIARAGDAGEAPSPGASNTFSVTSSSASEVIIEITPPPYTDHLIDVDGRTMRQFEGVLSGWTTEAGKPCLPSQGFLVAVPPGKSPVVDLIESKFTLVPSEEIAPAPAYSFNESAEAIPQYHADRAFYSAYNQFYPATTFETGEVAPIRDLQVAKIVVYPLQYNPATKQLKRFTHFKVRVKFQQTSGGGISTMAGAWQPVTSPDPYYEKMYKGLVLNYTDAEQWRGRPARRASATEVDSTRTWFQPGREYYRIPVLNDGLYHLSYGTLLNFGVNLGAINAATIALYNKGKSVPIYVHSVDTAVQQSYVEFYGERNHGAISYFNPYNDTNAYWFTWSDGSPRHYSEISIPSTPLDTTSWSMNNLWNELDKNYFVGVSQDDLLNTYDAPGEGWYWSDLVPGQSKVFPFTIDTIKRKTGVPVQLKARLFGMTTCTSASCSGPSLHRAFLYINRVLIDSITWQQNTEAIFSRSFPDSILRKGKDTLQIVSKTWPPELNNLSKFYLDWFQISYPKPLLGASGSLSFSATPTGSAVTAFLINGLPTDSVTIMDITNGRKISALSKINSTSFTFKDTVTTARNYFIVKEVAKAVPVRMDRKVFTDIRVNSAGADYVVITHSLFRGQADRLVQYHRSHDRMRAAVIDVQDIYDQFNYGLLDPASIKAFLKHAYYNWGHPSPTYAVFFGNASWDFKKNLASSVKSNFVPSYGNPPSDNAMVSFDSIYYYFPFMLTGRLPASTLQEATSVVNKIIGYGTPPLADWSKSFLFITGGDTPSEKFAFNYWSDELISSYVTVPPIGGTAKRVYKVSDSFVDGENKTLLQNDIASGVGFINFLGHSGGRLWGVDVGSPYEMQNTNGMLPFVSSVSCNVGFFSDPANNVLSEDFVLADNRGAIAVWAASSLGISTIGKLLVDKFLNMATRDYARDLGVMTTLSRINFWVLNNRYAAPLVIESLNLHPLIGDPATQWALPTKPDFAIGANNISVRNNPPLADSTVTMVVHLKNYGVMAGSPIFLSISDVYTDEAGLRKTSGEIVPAFYIPDFMQEDSVALSWNVKGKPGTHAITVRIDPKDSIPEVRKDNDVATHSFYIYRNTISVISPRPFRMLGTLTPTLSVTLPGGKDTTALTYYFEIDTAADFSSPYKKYSGAVTPGKVSASWQTPSLLQNKTYYWRAQNSALIGTYSKVGVWVTSSFQTTQSAVPVDTVAWQQSGRQLLYNSLSSASVYDSGATLMRSDSTTLYVRSLGSRASTSTDTYSMIQINDVKALGHWWDAPYSYIAAWYNPVDGSYQMKGFNLLTPTGESDMISFLKGIANGNYVMLAAVIDGKQNATDSLLNEIKALGSTKIDSLLAGQSWILLSLKGTGTKIIEVYNKTTAEGTLRLGNVFHNGPAKILTAPIGPAARWGYASWNVTLPNGKTSEKVQVLGLKNDTFTDTLMTLPSGTAYADLSAMNPATYPKIALLATLSCTDGASSPVLRQWNMHYLPPPDLAISQWSVKPQSDTATAGTPLHVFVDVYNLGSLGAAASRVSCYLSADTSVRFGSIIDSIAPGAHALIDAQFTPAVSSPGFYDIVTHIDPKAGKNDLLTENNTAVTTVYFKTSSAAAQKLRILFDDIEIHDGDFVAPKPLITVEYPAVTGQKTMPGFSAMIDGKELTRRELNNSKNEISSAGNRAVLQLAYKLTDGSHSLELKPLDGQTGNTSQPVNRVQFQVASAAGIRELFNYPNPFPSATMFSFILTGSQTPDDVTVKIYTVAGRIIRTIRLNPGQLQIGYNRVSWDGRDDQGDEIANGTYFYKITMNSGTESADALQRLVKIR